MPRKSAASLEVPTPHKPWNRIPPPDNLTPEQAARWVVITTTKPVDWFSDDNVGLLTELIRAETESARVAAELIQITTDEMRTAPGMARYTALAKVADLWAKQQTNLARALRLTPHSRIAPKVAGHAALRGGPKPWEGYGHGPTNPFDEF